MVPNVQEVRQIATWCNSCILRVESPTARSYFKASPAYFVSEPVVTALLAARFPRRVIVCPDRSSGQQGHRGDKNSDLHARLLEFCSVAVHLVVRSRARARIDKETPPS